MRLFSETKNCQNIPLCRINGNTNIDQDESIYGALEAQEYFDNDDQRQLVSQGL